MRPEAVIFDIGNVLIEWQPERYYDRVVGEARRRALFAAVDLHAMNERVDLGEGFRDVIHEQALAVPEFAPEIRMWHDNWLDLAQPVIAHSVHLMRALRRRGMPVFALTNFGRETWALAKPAYEFLDEFDRAYVSGHIGVTKPAAQIYEQVERDCGIAPGALLFTDDRSDNIKAAHERGWQTHLFTGPQAWAARLVEAGVLTAAEARI